VASVSATADTAPFSTASTVERTSGVTRWVSVAAMTNAYQLVVIAMFSLVFLIFTEYDLDMDTITPNWMTPKQVAGVLQLSLSTISRMCASGQLEAVRPLGEGRGKPVRITAESVQKAMTPVITKATKSNPEGETA
jgi:excisionase family DNA binding protein